jgi:hypothetical protein
MEQVFENQIWLEIYNHGQKRTQHLEIDGGFFRRVIVPLR